jgi:predicted transcriptional regulator
MYDLQLHLKEMPFLEGTMHSLGMLNYHPVSQVMAQPVVTLREVEKVGKVMDILATKGHNGFPIVSKEGRLRGIILRKTLCGLLKNKAYSTPSPADTSISTKINANTNTSGSNQGQGQGQGIRFQGAVTESGPIKLDQAATVFYDTLERVYPNYPDVKAIRLSDKEMVR